jgi:tetratricopeptide (TPR) repeat protein
MKPHRVVALLLLGVCSAAAEPVTPRAGLDCTEIADLEPLLALRRPGSYQFLAVEGLFHDLLLGWPASGELATAAELSDLEQRLSERLECLGSVRVAYPKQLPGAATDGPGALFLAATGKDGDAVAPFVCLAAIESGTFAQIFDDRPDTLLAIARLYQHKHAYQLRQGRLAYARRSLTQVEALLAAYAGATGEPADASSAATILAMAAVDMAALRVFDITVEAVAVLHRALEIDPDHHLALYLAAYNEEKLADYRHAREHLERLAELRAEDGEVELRLAVNLARTGDKNRAHQLLAGLVGSHPGWVAIVAAQELADLLTEEGSPHLAADVLGTALERFPGSSQLQLQLAQTRHSDWRASWPLVDRVLNGWQGDPGESARARYEEGGLRWISEEAAALDTGLEESRIEIVQAVGVLKDRSDRSKRADALRRASLCHGTLPLRRLPGDQGPGPFAPGSPGPDG